MYSGGNWAAYKKRAPILRIWEESTRLQKAHQFCEFRPNGLDEALGCLQKKWIPILTCLTHFTQIWRILRKYELRDESERLRWGIGLLTKRWISILTCFAQIWRKLRNYELRRLSFPSPFPFYSASRECLQRCVALKKAFCVGPRVCITWNWYTSSLPSYLRWRHASPAHREGEVEPRFEFRETKWFSSCCGEQASMLRRRFARRCHWRKSSWCSSLGWKLQRRDELASELGRCIDHNSACNSFSSSSPSFLSFGLWHLS